MNIYKRFEIPLLVFKVKELDGSHLKSFEVWSPQRKKTRHCTCMKQEKCYQLDSVHTMPAHFENGEKCDG